MKLFKIISAPFKVLSSLYLLIVTYSPGGFGNKLRAFYYRRKFKRCGNNLTIEIGTIIEGAEFISIGDNVHIDKYCIISTGNKLIGKIYKKENINFKGNQGELIIGNNVHIVQFCVIMAFGGIKIGNYCTLSSGCKLYSLTNISYDLEDKTRPISIMPYEQAPFLLGPIVLEDNVWFGLNCIAMPGATIQKNSFACSASLLMGEYPENSHISGQPAKRIKKRYEY